MKKLGKVLMMMCILTSFGVVSAFANPIDSDNAIGVFIMGTTESSVYGLQYQHWFNDKIGMQMEGAAYYNPDVYYGKELQYNISAEFQYKLYETALGERSATNLYAWLLAGHHGYIANESTYDAGTGTNVYTSTGFCANAIVGLGFGFDIMFLNHISIPVQFGFMGEFPNDPTIGFAFGSGLRYRF